MFCCQLTVNAIILYGNSSAGGPVTISCAKPFACTYCSSQCEPFYDTFRWINNSRGIYYLIQTYLCVTEVTLVRIFRKSDPRELPSRSQSYVVRQFCASTFRLFFIEAVRLDDTTPLRQVLRSRTWTQAHRGNPQRIFSFQMMIVYNLPEFINFIEVLGILFLCERFVIWRTGLTRFLGKWGYRIYVFGGQYLSFLSYTSRQQHSKTTVQNQI